jgi:hypothetical protein
VQGVKGTKTTVGPSAWRICAAIFQWRVTNTAANIYIIHKRGYRGAPVRKKNYRSHGVKKSAFGNPVTLALFQCADHSREH